MTNAMTHRCLAVLGAGVVTSLLVSVPWNSSASSQTDPIARAAECPAIVPGDVATAVIKTIRVGDEPQGVAVDSLDDTVYVTNGTSDTLSVINGRTATVSATIAGFAEPLGVAVNVVDDTVYVTNADDSRLSILSGRTLTAVANVPTGAPVSGVAVDQGDDTVYATRWDGVVGEGQVVVLDGTRQRLAAVVPIRGSSPWALGVDDLDDRVYVTGTDATSISVLNGRTASVESTIALSGNFFALAVHQADDTVYVTDYPVYGPGSTLSLVDGRSGTVAKTVSTLAGPWGVAPSEAEGRVYVANALVDRVSVLDARTGEPIMPPIAVGDFPTIMGVDESGANAGLVYVANSHDSSVSVLGSVRTTLASATGQPGEAIRVRVEAPKASFPLDDATVSQVCFLDAEGGASRVGEGLRRLSGDVWSVRVPRGLPAATYSVTVVLDGGLSARAGDLTVAPFAITGTRVETDPRIVRVDGVATGLAGKQVTPMVRFPGQASYSRGEGGRTVAPDGSFTWQRKTNRKVYVYFVHGDTRSNRVIISAR
jgi:YVTN family beta-propeller protein